MIPFGREAYETLAEVQETASSGISCRSNAPTSASTPTNSQVSLRQLIQWDDYDHVKVLTQINGSVWPRVWKFCLANVLIMCIIYVLRRYAGIDLKTSSALGHRYMAMVMSFLVVTRVVQSYNCYMADSSALHEMNRHVRECVVYACDTSDVKATEWRQEVSKEMLKLLSISMQVLHFRSRIYDERLTCVPEDLRVSEVSLREDQHQRSGMSSLEPTMIKGPTVLLVEACRAVSYQAFVVRKTILSYRETSFEPLPDEMFFLNTVANFLAQFDILEQHMTTPSPFPKVQMTKTFLFVWVFTLPFAIPVDKNNLFLLYLSIVFLITYGFVGLEIVAMELSDCFGDDDCDLDNHGLAEQCYEDCYLAIYKKDGREQALRLKRAVDDFHHDHRTRRTGTVAMDAALEELRLFDEDLYSSSDDSSS